MNNFNSIIFFFFLVHLTQGWTDSVKLEKNDILISRTDFSANYFPTFLQEEDMSYVEYNESYWAVEDIHFLQLTKALTKISPSFNWKCTRQLTEQQRIANSLLEAGLFHIVAINNTNNDSPYCYIFLSKDSNKVYSIQHNITDSNKLKRNYLFDKNSASSINHDFTLEELKLCDIALVADFAKHNDNNGKLVVSEIIKDTTQSTKIGDTLSPHSYKGIIKDTDSGAFFCRRFNHNFLNFLNKERVIDTGFERLTIDEVRSFLLNESNNKDSFVKGDSNSIFGIKEPYTMNQSFFEKEIGLCEILLISRFSESADASILSVSEVIRDNTNSLTDGDFLTRIPFREMLDPNYIGAIFCRRHNMDFLNFFSKDGLIVPDKIPISRIKK